MARPMVEAKGDNNTGETMEAIIATVMAKAMAGIAAGTMEDATGVDRTTLPLAAMVDEERVEARTMATIVLPTMATIIEIIIALGSAARFGT